VARLGGEEFAILLPNIKQKDALILAERIRQAVKKVECPISESEKADVTLTVSIGVAAHHQGVNTLDDLLREADTAMYVAKNQGKDRVVAAS
jgi:diguanylate cyclase (GGDEF)-like protein